MSIYFLQARETRTESRTLLQKGKDWLDVHWKKGKDVFIPTFDTAIIGRFRKLLSGSFPD